MSIPIKLGLTIAALSITSIAGLSSHDLLSSSPKKNNKARDSHTGKAKKCRKNVEKIETDAMRKKKRNSC